MLISPARILAVALCALAAAMLASPTASSAQQAPPPAAVSHTAVAAPQHAVSMPLRLIVTGAALVVGVMLGLIPAIVLGMLLGLIPRPARLAPEQRPARAPPAARRAPPRAPGVDALPPRARASAPVPIAEFDPDAPPELEVAESRERHRRLYDDAYSEQLRDLEALRRTISVRLAVPADRPTREEPDR
ncbi:MAG TPA: hypothetical protein VKB54_19855 [Solirubrobacteraceae bacterium]|nr:hypothetical protein [Solirubrobacteraceae bacterium]